MNKPSYQIKTIKQEVKLGRRGNKSKVSVGDAFYRRVLVNPACPPLWQILGSSSELLLINHGVTLSD